MPKQFALVNSVDGLEMVVKVADIVRVERDANKRPLVIGGPVPTTLTLDEASVPALFAALVCSD